MILIINTIERDKIELGIGNKTTEFFEFATENQSNDLLVKIDELLKSQKLSLQNITAIVVNQGPGSFTGVRVGITVANTLAWSLDIPIVGYHEGKLDDALAKISKNKFSKIALPFYK